MRYVAQNNTITCQTLSLNALKKILAYHTNKMYARYYSAWYKILLELNTI